MQRSLIRAYENEKEEKMMRFHIEILVGTYICTTYTFIFLSLITQRAH